MANLPSDLEKILQEETEFESPVSEAVIQKIGSSINGLIDSLSSSFDFTTSTTWEVPDNAEFALFIGCGGGGGGSGGGSRSSSSIGSFAVGGGGGAGATPMLVKVRVIPGDILTITIGAGGSGSSGGGGATSSGSSGGATTVIGTNIDLYFPGGEGGSGVLATTPGDVAYATPGGDSFNVRFSGLSASAGGSGNMLSSFNSLLPANRNLLVGTPASGGGGSAGGGGGGSGFGPGSNGAAGPSDAADATNYGAGGGGGGGRTSGPAGGDGGNGFQGFLRISLV